MLELTFAENLKNLMKTQNIRLEKIAREIGITKQAISNYTTGKTFPKPDILLRIADFFGVSLDFLLTGKPPIKTASKLLKLSEKAIENIMALSPDEAQALNDTFSDDIDLADTTQKLAKKLDEITKRIEQLSSRMEQLYRKKEERDFKAWPKNDGENYSDIQEFYSGVENAAKP